MAKLKPEFVDGCRSSGISQQVIDFLWATNEKSADYSFNKSHAACYALISYRTAWLKANYPAEYMAALISSVMDTKDKVPFFVAQAEQMGIEILPPDVNLSDHEFVVVDGNVRFGLDAVKGVGYAAVEAIKVARGDSDPSGAPHATQPFRDIWDFCSRIDSRAVNKKAIEALIKCGAFGSTGDSRKGMLDVLEQAQAAGQKAQQDAEIGQASIFDIMIDPHAPASSGGPGGGSGAVIQPAHAPIPGGEFDQTELLALEKESIGIFISAHPLKEIGPALRAKADCSLVEAQARKDGDWVTLGGMITQCKKIKTKTGTYMMFATLDDLEGQIEMIVFGETMEAAGSALAPDSIVLVRGRIDHKDKDKTTLVAQKVESFQPTEAEVEKARAQEAKPPPVAPAFKLHLDATLLPARVIVELKDVLSEFPGDCDVVIELVSSVGRRRLRLGPEFRVTRDANLHAELDDLLGAAIMSPAALDGAEPAGAVVAAG
jgi:DNA polymerase-3 subunit alpha